MEQQVLQLPSSDAPRSVIDAAPPEQALIEAARQDPRAFARLYRLHYQVIGTYLLRRVGDHHVAEDLISEVFLAAMRALPRYRQRGVPIRYWLLRIATNAANRWMRSERRRRRHVTAWGHATGTSPDTHATDAPRTDPDRAMRALQSLTPRHQAVIALHHVEGLSVEQVATVLGCRAGTVKSRLSRARQALREALRREQ